MNVLYGCLASLFVVMTEAELFGQGPPPAAVRVETVRTEKLVPRHFATGEVRAVRRSRVAGRESGLVLELPVRVGRRVAKDDLIARLDDRLLSLQVSEIDADHAVASAQLEERRAAAELARWRFEAYTALKERGSSHESEVRQAAAEIATSTAAVARAEKQLLLLDAQKATVEQRRRDLKIVAPFDGIVASRLAEEGEWLAAGTPLIELISDQEMEAWIEVPESLAGAVAGGTAEIELIVPAIGLESMVKEYRSLPEINARTRTFSIVIPLKDGAEVLKPGMSVRARVPGGEPSDVLTLPLDAVMRNEVGLFVFVASPSGTEGAYVATPKRIEKLFTQGGRLAVRGDDLQAGDYVVSEGNERLFPGAPILLINPVAEASR